jgi:Cu/Ag efflux pump CusA
MRFQVPQFIDVEDKLFGPLTFKQFIYIAGAVGLSVIFFTLLPTFIALLLSVPVLVFGAALAFYKVNNLPFVRVAEDFLHYSTSSKLYIWKKEENKPVVQAVEAGKPTAQVYVPKLSESKLKDLSWSLDIKNQNSQTKDTV